MTCNFVTALIDGDVAATSHDTYCITCYYYVLCIFYYYVYIVYFLGVTGRRSFNGQVTPHHVTAYMYYLIITCICLIIVCICCEIKLID